MSLTIPKDFTQLLVALNTARQVGRPVALHDKQLAAALHARGFTEPCGSGWVGACALEGFLALPDAGRVVAILLGTQEAATGPAGQSAPQSAPASAPETAPLAGMPGAELRLRALDSEPPAPPARGLTPVEDALLKHVQILDVHIDGLRRQMEALLAHLEPAIRQLPTKSLRDEYVAKLPPSALRRKLESEESAS